MSIRHVAATIAVAFALPSAPAAAQDPSAMSCGQLRHAKNALLKAKGFCFSDRSAAQAFGNDGCTIHDPNQVPLTSAERQTMARILLAERIKMCR